MHYRHAACSLQPCRVAIRVTKPQIRRANDLARGVVGGGSGFLSRPVCYQGQWGLVKATAKEERLGIAVSNRKHSTLLSLETPAPDPSCSRKPCPPGQCPLDLGGREAACRLLPRPGEIKGTLSRPTQGSFSLASPAPADQCQIFRHTEEWLSPGEES